MRRARLTINADALRHNLAVARSAAQGRSIFAAVKADGYGHGLLTAARAFSAAGTDGFAVATAAEGIALRKAGQSERVLVLQGAMTAAELDLVARNALEPVFHDPAQLEVLEAHADELPAGALRAWLKVDTGMHRAGFRPEQVTDARARLSACAAVAPPIGLMTHFARADEPDLSSTESQIEVFRSVASGFGGETSLCNSAALLGCETAGGDWVRPGIMLYGGNPFVFGQASQHELRPAMELKTELIAVREVPQGGAIGYGGRFVAPENMQVGLAAVGYGDGYPRHAPDGTPILINGRRTQIVGRVSMDLITVDLRGIEARVGDEVECWGGGLPIDEIARASLSASNQMSGVA